LSAVLSSPPVPAGSVFNKITTTNDRVWVAVVTNPRVTICSCHDSLYIRALGLTSTSQRP